MSGRWLPVAVFAVASLVVARAGGHAEKPAQVPANRENIKAALKLTQAAAAEYEIRVNGDAKPLELRREPVLRWSNPEQGEIHGNVFLWTRDGRPLVVGSLFKWFSPDTHMSHEFQSLAEKPLRANFHGKPVWKPSEPGLRFVDVPGTAAPAANEAQRLLQLRQLAKDFTSAKKERDGNQVELRLLPQPIHRYAAPKQGIVNGALFAFVQGTDPELLVLIEARGATAASTRWQFAAARISSVELRLRHRERQVWTADMLPGRKITDRTSDYTIFRFDAIPDFLKETLDERRP